MKNNIRLKLTGNQVTNRILEFTINVPNLINITDTVKFVTVVIDPNNQCLIGVDLPETMTNLNNWMVNYITNVQPTLLPYSTVTNGVDGIYSYVNLEVYYNKEYVFSITSPLNSSIGNIFQLDIKKNGSVLRNYDKSLTNSTNNTFSIPIGVSALNTLTNVTNNFITYNSSSSITYYLSVDGVLYITCSGIVSDIFTMLIYSNTSKLVFNNIGFENTDTSLSEFTFNQPDYFPYDIVESRIRSTQQVKSNVGVGYSSTQYTIYKHSGDIGSTKSLGKIVSTVTKNKILPTQNNTYINYNNLVRESFEGYIDGYGDNNFTTPTPINVKEGYWLNINKQNKLIGDTVEDSDELFFITDGYVEWDEINGLPQVLNSARVIDKYRYGNDRIYFQKKFLSKITYQREGVDAIPIIIILTGNVFDSSEYIQSLKIFNNSSIDNCKSITYTFEYDTGFLSQTVVKYNLIDECKYDNYDLVFKNKYGFLQSISMSKKSSKSITSENKEYLRGIVDMNGDYNMNKHTNKQYNISGAEEWVLNTGYINEGMNPLFEESLLSEELYLLDKDGRTIPVIKVDNKIDFKTRINDKLIQYTIKVKLSHNKIKTI